MAGGEKIHINLLPDLDIPETLKTWAQAHPAQELKTVLGRELPKRFVDKLVELGWLVSKPMRQYNERELEAVATLLGDWQILPNGTEGYRTAEVTLGEWIPTRSPPRPWRRAPCPASTSSAKWWM